MRKIKMLAASESSAIDLNPMLDVIFILLIFFILVSTFISEKVLPEVSSNHVSSESQRVSPIEVELRQNGHVFVDDRIVSKSALRAVFLHKKSVERDRALIIRAEELAPVESYVAVMDASRQANLKNVQLKVSEASN